MRSPPWNDAENGALVALYFVMLERAIAGDAYNKAAMIRNEIDQPDAPNRLMTYPLADRSRGSVEAKLMNASAAHRDLVPGATTMDGYGYRCLSNYQAALKDAMAAALITCGACTVAIGAHTNDAGCKNVA